MKKFYRICFHNICIEAPFFPQGSSDWQPFETNNNEFDLKMNAVIRESLPRPQTPSTGQKGLVSVWAQGDNIYRESRMGTANGSLTRYSNSANESSTFFTRESYNVMMDSRYMWNSLSLAQLFLPRKTLFIHSSYIDIGGKALLFSAPCGTGKSTQAALWQKHRHAEIINGDKAGISIFGDKVFAHGVPFCGTSKICRNRSLPLGAIVLLSQAKENTVTRINGVEALRGIMENIYLDFLAPDEQLMCVDLIIEILSSVPVYRLSCTPDENAVIALETWLRNGGII